MHYYAMNIGDYHSHTSHLTEMEDLAYRRLLDFYYLHEAPIVDDIESISRKIKMNGRSTDVQQVLNEFFKLVEGAWVNGRADKEILAFKGKKKQASEAGKASGLARSERMLNDRSTDAQPNIKHKQLTINHISIVENLPEENQTANININEPPKDENLTTEKKATQLHKNFKPDETCKDFSLQNGLKIDMCLAEFEDFHRSKGSISKDWQAAFRTWLRNAVKFRKTGEPTELHVVGLY